MPELAEVESFRILLERYCVHSVIVCITQEECGGGSREGMRDSIIHQSDSLILSNTLLQQQIEKINRKGKYLWFEMTSISSRKQRDRREIEMNLSERGREKEREREEENQDNDVQERFEENQKRYVLFHFGMTGSFVFKGKDIPIYKSFTISNQWPPKFTKLLITFENGEEIAFVDPRRLGRIKACDDVLNSDPVMNLAPDCYTNYLSGEYIYSIVQTSSISIKTLLLDQSKLCCGIGNWLADEILFQSHIHPLTRANLLSLTLCRRLSEVISSILRIACDVEADSDQFPSDWIFHRRWEKFEKKTGRKKGEDEKSPSTTTGYVVKFVTVNGRTSAFVPELQKEIKENRSFRDDPETPSLVKSASVNSQPDRTRLSRKRKASLTI